MKNITVASRIAFLAGVFSLVLTAVAPSARAQYSYYALTPCRVVDTRNANGVDGGPILGSFSQRSFTVRGVCGVPTTAKAVSLNLAITGMTAGGFVTLWPSGLTRPVVSSINFSGTEPALSNGAIVGLSTNAQDLSVYDGSPSSVHIILDVTGYFQ
ncbi:MAG TPA: hypothetical protein VLC46_27675 [Thermoanaerobaculia bacterium]|jgi:hypothetical protein|nr:hypothetical protein [Thermoanaerobaculia bacterium]